MSQPTSYTRFVLARRIEHWLLFLSFSLLALTGLVQKFSTVALAQSIIGFFGGIETTRIIHRTAAILFGLETIYHFVVMGYKTFVLREKAEMFPELKDAADGFQTLLYNLGITKTKPKMGRYNFTEKLEYWAMMWGVVIMGLTGFMMWNPIGTTNLLPGQVIPAAKTAHGAEAVLAVLSLILWHGYHVHLRTFNTAMFNGKISRHEMEEEHALELEQIESGEIKPTTIPKALLRKRQWIYGIVSGTISIAAVVLLFIFITYEKTAITTLPPQQSQVEVFVPQTATPIPTRTRTPTAAPTHTALPATPAASSASEATESPSQSPSTGDSSEELVWDDVAGLFAEKCTACHGSMGGLSLKSYDDLLKGGKDGPAIIPGDPENSLIILKMAGEHAAKFSEEELAKIKAWIGAGAKE